MLDLVLDLFDVFDRSDTLYAAYKGAWKRRMATGDDDLGLLEAEMKNRNVPGAYDPHDSRRIAPAVRAWAGGIAPREARSVIKHAPKHRDEMQVDMPLIDIERLLRRIVSDVFDSTIEVTYTAHPKYENDWRVALVSTTDRRREIELRATYEWFTAHIEELDVGTIVFAYDDDEKESELRDLALMAREYLEGEGYVRVKPRLFGRKGRTSLFIETDDTLWELGRRRSSIEPA